MAYQVNANDVSPFTPEDIVENTRQHIEGDGEPKDSEGQDGDTYGDRETGAIYRKENGRWEKKSEPKKYDPAADAMPEPPEERGEIPDKVIEGEESENQREAINQVSDDMLRKTEELNQQINDDDSGYNRGSSGISLFDDAPGNQYKKAFPLFQRWVEAIPSKIIMPDEIWDAAAQNRKVAGLFGRMVDPNDPISDVRKTLMLVFDSSGSMHKPTVSMFATVLTKKLEGLELIDSVLVEDFDGDFKHGAELIEVKNKSRLKSMITMCLEKSTTSNPRRAFRKIEKNLEKIQQSVVLSGIVIFSDFDLYDMNGQSGIGAPSVMIKLPDWVIETQNSAYPVAILCVSLSASTDGPLTRYIRANSNYPHITGIYCANSGDSYFIKHKIKT